MPSATPTRSAVDTATDTATDSVFRLSVEQYHATIDTGVLNEDDPVELIGGVLTDKTPKNRRHRVTVTKLNAAIFRLLPPGWFHQIQDPIHFPDSEPEPDIAVIRGTPDDVTDSHPAPPDILLVVEISDTTRPLDRTIKKSVYVRAAIPHYWIVNLASRAVEAFSLPHPESATYTHSQTFTESTPIPIRPRSPAC